ncbi:MAG TPA: penicillin-binding protein activator, partial [Nitrospiraceae bacterium]|nr:penicillin-binding protein activator [Nitrospiraceae bacterium]
MFNFVPSQRAAILVFVLLLAVLLSLTLTDSAPPPIEFLSVQANIAWAEQRDSGTSQTAKATLEQAKTMLETNRPDAAVTILKDFIASSPQSQYLDDAYLLIAAALSGIKEYAQAVSYLNQLLSEFPTSDLADRARLMLGAAQAKLGNLDLALPALAEVRSLTSDPVTKREALKLTGEILTRKKDFLRAIQAWLEEMDLAPEEQKTGPRERIRELVAGKLDKKTLLRVRDTYPADFPGDVALIRLIDLFATRGEEHLAERNIRLFLARFPTHEYAQTATEKLRTFKAKLKASQYVVAAVLPLSGRMGLFGTEALNGIQLALEKGKESLGLTSIGLVVKDTEPDKTLLLSDLYDLVNDNKPLAVIGPLLSRDLPMVADLAEKLETPFITPSATLTNVRQLGTYLFSTALTYPQQAHRIADYASSHLGQRRFCILHPDTTYGRELTRFFTQEIRQRGGEIIAVESYKETDTDFGPQIRRLKAEDLKRDGTTTTTQTDKGVSRIVYTPGFDAIFLPANSAQAALIVPQLLFYDVKVPVLGSNGWNQPDLLRLADRSIEGATFVDGFFLDSPDSNVQDFVERYQRRFQSSPSLFAAQAYDATRLVLEAVRKGATSGEGVRDQFMKLH